MDEDEEVYARIAANVAANRLLESRLPARGVVEKAMSLETVMEQRRKADEIAKRLRDRATLWTDGPHGS
jgi:hypothetical protein